jgi:raffinose/stachyose/melibiose transport system permease protein
VNESDELQSTSRSGGGATVAAPSQKRSWLHSRRFRRQIMPWLFIAPITLLHLVVVVGPSVAGMYYSLTEWSGIGKAEFVGLDNFRELFFEDRNFLLALRHNLMWLAVFLTVPFAMALGVATLLAQVRIGSMAIRTAFFIPYVLPSVVVASIWRMLLDPRLGFGVALENWGIKGLAYPFLGDKNTALAAIAFVDNWHWWGFLMILFLTAMQSIPSDLYDAAKIDGANRWQEFRHVTLPGIRPILLFMYMMVAIWSFLAFDYIFLLTQGGPGGASEVIATQLYKNAFFRFQAGYGAAQGVVISIFAGFIILIFVTLRRRGWDI